jgi:thiamine biosynthesis lipoprotein
MGTTWRVDLFASTDHSQASLLRNITAELDRIVSQMSHWRDDSDLSRFNNTAAAQWVELPSELFHVIESAVSLCKETGGAFNAGIGPLVDAWGFGPKSPPTDAPPADAAVAKHAIGCGSHGIQINPDGRRVFQPGGVRFDLSSIAKGYAVDRVCEMLDVPGISSCLAEIGGELRSRGVKPNGEPWWVAVEQPPDAEGFPETVIGLCGLSVASSGNYRRYFEHEGTRYSHTIDPRSGRPAGDAITSVTVVHEQCMLADAYSTAIAVLGPHDGMAFANRLGIAAQLISRKGNSYGVSCSSTFQEMLDP